ncbi:MAG: auxin-regulated protein [Proteobacteria bacterium]|nr:MAG: auxin-regulated protein [Pseudomonadota bacterium]
MLNATPLLKLYAKIRRAKLNRTNYAEQQEQELLKLVKISQNTEFGIEHKFNAIKSVSDFQNRVPLRRYEQFWEGYFKERFPKLNNITWPGVIPYFAVSSGTTSGTTKWIPYTHEMTSSNAKAGVDLLVHHVTQNPASRLMAGKSFVLGGSSELVERTPGVYSGDLSGIAVKTLPLWARARYFPPQKLALLKNWEEKIQILGRESLKQNIRSISGVPSWLLIFFEKMTEIVPGSGGKICNIYPKLEMLVHGGVSFAPYHKKFLELLEGSRAELREVYPASEGFIAVGDRSYGDGLRMIIDHGIFFEFVPLEEIDKPSPTRHWVRDLELGVNYAVIITNCAGLWSYVLGDTVRFVDRDPPRLLVTGRISYYLSAFGEHVIDEELEDSVSYAAASISKQVVDYSVGPIFPSASSTLGGHLYVVEFAQAGVSTAEIESFAGALDKRLSERNEDYEAHRAGGYGLNPPKVILAKPGAFAAWMKSRGKLGGKHKVPRIINDTALLDSLRTFAEAYK